MELKNKEIKKLFNSMAPYFDLFTLPSTMSEFMACDGAIEGEIAALKAELTALKAELTDANQYKDIYRNSSNNLRSSLFERGDELRKANNQIEVLKRENVELRKDNDSLANTIEQYKNSFVKHHEANNRQRVVIDALEEEINTLKKTIHALEEENVNLRVAPSDANKPMRSRIEVLAIGKHIWHGDGNAMTGECGKSLAETIEFQNKKIEELEAEKARLKEAYDIHESTIERLKLLLTQQNEIDALKKENSELRTLKVDLSYGHEFEFGDEVFVPWSDAPYMYVKTGLLYNTRTKRLVYVGKDQHLKWFGEKFAIV